MTVITSPTIYSASADTITKKGGIFKISSLGELEYISRQKPIIEATTFAGLVELAQLGTTIIDGGYIKTSLVDADALLTDVLFVGDMLDGGFLQPSLIDIATLVGDIGLGSLAYNSVVEAAQLGTTVISGGFLKNDLIDTDVLLADVLVVGSAAADINAGATTISGGKITTNSIEATKLNVTALSAITSNIGDARAGQLNFGNFIGFAWPASGGGAHLSASGLLMGNYSTGQYLQITSAGAIYAPGLSIAGGSATFSGTLSANIVNATNIVGGAVSSMSGYTTTDFTAYAGGTYAAGLSAAADTFWAGASVKISFSVSPQSTIVGQSIRILIRWSNGFIIADQTFTISPYDNKPIHISVIETPYASTVSATVYIYAPSLIMRYLSFELLSIKR